jgi:hypothetical protein
VIQGSYGAPVTPGLDRCDSRESDFEALLATVEQVRPERAAGSALLDALG